MNKNLKFVIWIVSVLIFAFVVGRFREPFEVNKPITTTAQYAGRGHVSGHATPTVPSPSPVSSPATTPATSVAVAPPNSTSTAGSAPAPVNTCSAAATTTVINTARGARTVVATTLPVSDLYQMIDSSPSCISGVVFRNGVNAVHVVRTNGNTFDVNLSDEGGKAALMTKLASAHVPFGVVPVDPVAGFVSNNFGTILMVGLAILFFVGLRRAQAAQMGKMTGMGKSRGKDVSKGTDKVAKVTFKDVAGADEAVKELRRVVKGIVGAQIYSEFGAELPRGIMLKGPPGTGKTLLARAVANETDGNFIAESGSGFVEMLVGVGAARVRELFATARKTVAETKKPYIIFIDEIDAVGGKRSSGMGSGGNREAEQTLNELLVQMDGIIDNEGIIIIGATNRIDMLDEALLRPGRFEVHVNVDLPDRAGREAIFAIHVGKRPLAANVTMAALADRTFGYSGAEIKAICNRASIIAAERFAARLNSMVASGMTPAQARLELTKEVTLNDFDEGIDFVRYGNADPGKQSRMRVEDKENTSVHESGHACAAVVAPGVDPVVKITIMNRSKALGYVQTMPDNDRVSFTRTQALSRIVMAMAGRAAQQVILGTCDTGASNDFEQATDMARKMVASWGMSRLGPISVGQRGAGPFGGGGGNASYGDDLSNEIDREWRYIVDLCYAAAVKIVTADKERLMALHEILMKQETVLAGEWKALMERYPSKIKWEDLDLPLDFTSMAAAKSEE
ncbi:MAG: AAA family ATPase [Cyanobacteria bacterium REEB67]|nr:AAA family ATPase [Cyanobacteria bacterium REEB67]